MPHPLFTIILTIALLTSGCWRADEVQEHPAAAPADGEVVDMHGNVRSLGRMDALMEAIRLKQDSSLRVSRYTIEGDPIYFDVSYAGGRLKLLYDASHDKFGGDKQPRNYTCSWLDRQETDTLLSYTLKGCTGDREWPEIELLHIEFDAAKQDVFGFSLRYGTDLKNGGGVELSDTGLSAEERQQIYKQIVLSGYLLPKKLSAAACSIQPYMAYHLQVRINSAVRDYDWSECDSSEDGKTMTALAQAMIGIR